MHECLGLHPYDLCFKKMTFLLLFVLDGESLTKYYIFCIPTMIPTYQPLRGSDIFPLNLQLFKRSFFRTSNIEDFPKDIRYVVQKDYRGIYYIDFYYCIAHHERSDDCTPYLCRLKNLFNGT